MSDHISRPTTQSQQGKAESSLTMLGPKPKKKCFEDILREAEERVVRESAE